MMRFPVFNNVALLQAPYNSVLPRLSFLLIRASRLSRCSPSRDCVSSFISACSCARQFLCPGVCESAKKKRRVRSCRLLRYTLWFHALNCHTFSREREDEGEKSGDIGYSPAGGAVINVTVCLMFTECSYSRVVFRDALFRRRLGFSAFYWRIIPVHLYVIFC